MKKFTQGHYRFILMSFFLLSSVLKCSRPAPIHIFVNNTEAEMQVIFNLTGPKAAQNLAIEFDAVKTSDTYSLPKIVANEVYYKRILFYRVNRRSHLHDAGHAEVKIDKKAMTISVPKKSALYVTNPFLFFESETLETNLRDLTDITIKTENIIYIVPKNKVAKVFTEVQERIYEWSLGT